MELIAAVKLIFTPQRVFLLLRKKERGRRRRQKIMTLGQLKISDRVKFVVAPSVWAVKKKKTLLLLLLLLLAVQKTNTRLIQLGVLFSFTIITPRLLSLSSSRFSVIKSRKKIKEAFQHLFRY